MKMKKWNEVPISVGMDSVNRNSSKISWRGVLLFAFCLFFASINTYAQQDITIAGKVISATDGAVMPGVTVIVKGTQIGTTTDIEGAYTIKVDGQEAVLLFSFIGFVNKEIIVGSQTAINVELTEDLIGLNEVVVIGYGTTTKKEVTGSVASVKAEDFIQGDVASPLGAIQGVVPGLSILASNGSDPTSDYTIRIRGLNSFSGGKSPLIIVDGVVWSGSLASINPEQIQSIDILKDGSAAAIYGTRATNGVILITLKAPMKGKVKFEFSSYMSLQAVEKDKYWLNSNEYREAINQFAPNQESLDKGGNTNWLDETTRNPVNQNYNIAITGGTDNISFRTNFTYKDSQGLFAGNHSKVLSPSILVNQQAFNGRLKINYKLLYSKTENSDVPDDLYYQVLTRNPTEPVYDPTNVSGGGYYDNHLQDSKNPVAMLNESTYERDIHFVNTYVNADYELTSGLFVKFSATYNTWQGFDGNYQTKFYPMLGKTGKAYVGSWNTSDLTIEPSVNYRFSILDEHRFRVMAGYSYNEGNTRSFSADNANFDTDKFSYNNIEAGNDLIEGIAGMESSRESNKLIAFYGRATYNVCVSAITYSF